MSGLEAFFKRVIYSPYRIEKAAAYAGFFGAFLFAIYLEESFLIAVLWGVGGWIVAGLSITLLSQLVIPLWFLFLLYSLLRVAFDG